MAPYRTYLGGSTQYGLRTRVYRIPDALEVDEVTVGEIRRSRVYFDDVLLITYHQDWGIVALVLLGILFLASAGITLFSLLEGASTVPIVFFGVAVFFLLLLIVRLILRIDVITVFGRRTSAQLKFSVRKGRARRVGAELERAIRATQARSAASRAKPPPSATPGAEAPPPPPGTQRA
jgi:hypothetical protein